MMATGWKIEIEDTRRACILRDGTKCLFHRWGEYRADIKGVLEFEDGHIDLVSPSHFFFDDGGQFGSFIWFSYQKKGEE